MTKPKGPETVKPPVKATSDKEELKELIQEYEMTKGAWDVLVDVVLPQGPNHWSIGETGVDDAAEHTVKYRLLRERGGSSFQSRVVG